MSIPIIILLVIFAVFAGWFACERFRQSRDERLAARLKASVDPLRRSVEGNQISGQTPGKKKGTYMAQEMDDLEAQIKVNEDVEASALLLINGFAARLAAAGVDPVKLKTLRDELKANADALAAAVAQNTPGA